MTAELAAAAPLPPAPVPAELLPAQGELERMMFVAGHLANTEFVPKGLRGKQEAVLAAMLTGRELGIGPMRALRQVDVIQGRPAPEPELLMALVLRAGHEMRVTVATRERAVVRCRRKEWPADDYEDVEFTWEDAETAGLTTKDNYQNWPRAMMRSRAVGEACRTHFPDVSEGASYPPEELGGTIDPRAAGGILDGLPDDLAAQVSDGMDPATGVQEAADAAVSDGVLTGEQADALVAYARKHPAHPQRAIERIARARAEAPRGAVTVDAEVVREPDPLDTVKFSTADRAQMRSWGVDEDTRHALMSLASDGRTESTKGDIPRREYDRFRTLVDAWRADVVTCTRDGDGWRLETAEGAVVTVDDVIAAEQEN